MRADESLNAVLADVVRLSAMSDEALGQALRGAFPDLHFSVCDDSDMSPRVRCVAENTHCRLYYVSSADHCLQLTSDATTASGFVVARRLGDDD